MPRRQYVACLANHRGLTLPSPAGNCHLSHLTTRVIKLRPIIEPFGTLRDIDEMEASHLMIVNSTLVEPVTMGSITP